MKESSEDMGRTGAGQRNTQQSDSNAQQKNDAAKNSGKGPGTDSSAGHETGRPDDVRRESSGSGQQSQSGGSGQQPHSGSGASQANNAGNTGFGSGQISPQTHDQSNRGGSSGRSGESDRNR